VSSDVPTYEAVLEVTEYYDGPRQGVALFRGKPYRFRSKWLDIYGTDDTTDTFELTAVGVGEGDPVIATATFEVADDASPVPPGQLRKLVVAWGIVDELRSNSSLEHSRDP
jgi:hypothetical protein